MSNVRTLFLRTISCKWFTTEIDNEVSCKPNAKSRSNSRLTELRHLGSNMDSMWCWNVVAFIVLFIAKTANPAHQMAGKYGDAIDFTKICTIYFEDRVEKKRTWSNQAPYHPLKETVLLGDLTTEGGSKLQEIFEGTLQFKNTANTGFNDNDFAHAEYKKTMKGDEAVTICKLDALAHQISLPTLVEDWKEIVVPLSKMITNSIPAVMSPNAHFIGEGVGAHLWHGVSEELKRIVNNPMKRITGWLRPLR